MKRPRFLLDENVGAVVAAFLRHRGYDVVSIAEDSSGARDYEILARAVREKRVVITLDKDFGILAYQQSRTHAGVVLLHLVKESPENIIRALEEVIRQHRNRLPNSFISASEYSIRIRSSKK